jgi:hypothetical protein
MIRWIINYSSLYIYPLAVAEVNVIFVCMDMAFIDPFGELDPN